MNQTSPDLSIRTTLSEELTYSKTRPKTLSRFSQKSQFDDNLIEGSTECDSTCSISELSGRFPSQSELFVSKENSINVNTWEKIYERVDAFLDKVNCNIVSPSPALHSRVFNRVNVKAVSVMVAQTRYTDCSSPLVCASPLLLKNTSKSEKLPGQTESNEEVKQSLTNSPSLSLNKESSVLMRRRNLLKLERSNSFNC